MDLVVVCLTNAGKNIIIPEHYIYGLDYKQLKNNGKNACRDQLVYWSDDCIEGFYYPEIDKNAVVKMELPAGNGAWYHGRTIYFTGKIYICFSIRIASVQGIIYFR